MRPHHCIRGASLLAATVLFTAGCGEAGDLPSGQDGAPAGQPGPVTPDGSAPHAPSTESSGGAFDFDPLDATPRPDPLGDTIEGRGLLRELPPAPMGEGTTIEGADGTEDPLDPCTLVTPDEWTAWAGPGGRSQIELEHGEVCGFIDEGDTLRMAIGWLPHLGGDRFLTADDRAAGQPVSVQGHNGFWLTGWPVHQSSMLVLELADGDLGIEVSTLGDVQDPDLREGARAFAELALGRLA